MFTTTTRGGNRNQRNNPYVLDELFATFHRSPAGTIWRWRTEAAILCAATAALWRLSILISLIWATVALAVLAVIVLAVPAARRFFTRRFWCVLARHRLQRLCYEARLHTRAGRLPLVLWTHPTKVGERARVLCRAGICAEDFEAHIGELRAACYARDARVTRSTRWSHLVTIDIIRRDTLAASQTVASPLPALAARHHHPVASSRDLADPRPATSQQPARNDRPAVVGHVLPAHPSKEASYDRDPGHRAGIPAVHVRPGPPRDR